MTGAFDDTDYDEYDGTAEPADPRENWRYGSVQEWVDKWFRHVMAGQFGKEHRWCAQWWSHAPVAVRLDALWQAWETAVLADDGAAMSAWWVHHADPHWRAITAESGPLHLCDQREHTDTKLLPVTPAPPGWFDA